MPELGIVSLIAKLFGIPLSLVFILAYMFNIYGSLVVIESTKPEVGRNRGQPVDIGHSA